MISSIDVLYYFKCPLFKKNNETCKETGKCVLFTRNKRQSIEISFEEAQRLDLLEQDFKSVTIKMFIELKQIMSKEIKENMTTVYHQRISIRGKICKKQPNRNFRAEKYNN